MPGAILCDVGWAGGRRRSGDGFPRVVSVFVCWHAGTERLSSRQKRCYCSLSGCSCFEDVPTAKEFLAVNPGISSFSTSDGCLLR